MSFGHILTPEVVDALQKHYATAHAAATDDIAAQRITARAEEVRSKPGVLLSLDEHEDAAVRRALESAGTHVPTAAIDPINWSQPAAA